MQGVKAAGTLNAFGDAAAGFVQPPPPPPKTWAQVCLWDPSEPHFLACLQLPLQTASYWVKIHADPLLLQGNSFV